MKTFFFGFMLSNDILYLFCGLIYYTCVSRVKHMVIFFFLGWLLICCDYLLQYTLFTGTSSGTLMTPEHVEASNMQLRYVLFLSKDRETVSVKLFGDFWKGKERDKVCMVINSNADIFSNPIKYTRVSFDRNVSF